MRIVFATERLASLGGSESYLLTVADHLERLGHDVILAPGALGEASAIAGDRGLRVAERPEQLPATTDAVISQDQPSALSMAARYPHVPNLFVCHAAELDIGQPPLLDGAISGIVAMSERVSTKVAAMAGAPQAVHRLNQPVDLDRFAPRGPIGAVPRRALLLGNYLRGQRRALVLEALAAAGIEPLQIGRHGVARADPERAIADADLVIGYGRSVVEGMAGGRAAYVLDHEGGDGWVTPESWAAYASGAFAGRSTDRVVDLRLLREDLGRYEAAMGLANRDLAVLHHGARQHAKALVSILRELGAADPLPAPIDEMARLARLAWRSESRAQELIRELSETKEAQDALLAEMWKRINDAEDRSLAADDRELHARAELADLREQRRVRLANALCAPLDRRKTRSR